MPEPTDNDLRDHDHPRLPAEAAELRWLDECACIGTERFDLEPPLTERSV